MIPSEDREFFSTLVRQLRKDRGLSLARVAAIFEVLGGPSSKTFINDIERARINPPRDDVLYMYAEALDYPSDLLFYAAGRIPKDLRRLDLDSIKGVLGAFREGAERLK